MPSHATSLASPTACSKAKTPIAFKKFIKDHHEITSEGYGIGTAMDTEMHNADGQQRQEGLPGEEPGRRPMSF
jgi:hypothetical protein